MEQGYENSALELIIKQGTEYDEDNERIIYEYAPAKEVGAKILEGFLNFYDKRAKGFPLDDSEKNNKQKFGTITNIMALSTLLELKSLDVDISVCEEIYYNLIERVFAGIYRGDKIVFDFLGNGYYIETEPAYTMAAKGNQNWPRTLRQVTPLIQTKNGVNSPIYTEFVVRKQNPNADKEITQINRFCVYEAFKRLGWLYIPSMPEDPGPHPDVKTSIAIVRDKLARTFEDKRKMLFQNMKYMLEYLDEKTSDKQFYFGTDDFDHVWERLIDRAFGERDKEKYFPRSRWLLDYGKYKEKHPLMPDTIMIYNGKYYVLDAKCYRYGVTGVPDHLPNGSSINKQITYGEYLEKHKCIDAGSIFNAFIMPFNMAKNYFHIDSPVGVIGEAVGDWRRNDKPYERIQGIVMDTRYLMYHYLGKPMKDRVALADCIEAVLNRGPIK